jgi:hypothetical protein
MRAGVLVTGVLGAGSVLVFAAATLTASLFPNGTVVRTSWGGGWGGGPWIEGGGWAPGAEPIPMPMVLPERGLIEGDVFVESVGGVEVGPVPPVPAPVPLP